MRGARAALCGPAGLRRRHVGRLVERRDPLHRDAPPDDLLDADAHRRAGVEQGRIAGIDAGEEAGLPGEVPGPRHEVRPAPQQLHPVVIALPRLLAGQGDERR
ncbi:MAG TPA: hypothetical protein VFC23_02730 [Thermoanaerobaculia bacterium]|nr:hypothetical protein [Thermoanaerobaculia bacterium]